MWVTTRPRQLSFAEGHPEDFPFQSHAKSAYPIIPQLLPLGTHPLQILRQAPLFPRTHLIVKTKDKIKGMCIWFRSVSSLGQWGRGEEINLQYVTPTALT